MARSAVTITGVGRIDHDVVDLDCSADQRWMPRTPSAGVLGTLIVSLLQAARAFPPIPTSSSASRCN